jgi:tankyrase
MKANVKACDKGLLQPLHNSASYGHIEVAEILIQSGADVNAQDIYLFTPLHEASIKKKYEICKLLIKNGADPNLKNRDGQSALDIAIKLDDEDLIDILRGDLALLDACKKGNLNRVKKLLTPNNINFRDPSGRHSSGLHLVAGYNHLEVAEYLLKNEANAEIKDKGGLIPLHNAASYGHVEMAALLLKYNPHIINITDKWGYTSLHE